MNAPYDPRFCFERRGPMMEYLKMFLRLPAELSFWPSTMSLRRLSRISQLKFGTVLNSPISQQAGRFHFHLARPPLVFSHTKEFAWPRLNQPSNPKKRASAFPLNHKGCEKGSTRDRSAPFWSRRTTNRAPIRMSW